MSEVADLTALAGRHHDWVERMGWHNKTTLETLGLIGTEIVEAQEEILLYQELPLHLKPACYDGFWTRLSEEMADITLRLMDLSVTAGFDLTVIAERAGPSAWKSRVAENAIAELLIDWKQCMNAARKAKLDEDFMQKFGRLVRRVLDYAEVVEMDLLGEVLRKMAINAENGTRGRLM
ncbi:hypothetical protein AB4Y45_32645 [Paraburkholderia sp. EG287A]|uniref:hypothetical protein n=1 Tax=Paraburkholderia sp. EG287A TaxID=3237012 RepID=UPI0034D2880B